MKTADFQTFQGLDNLHLSLLADVKSSCPIWEDIIGKGGKLFASLRATVHASNAFLDAVQRLADLASKTSGGSKEIGAHFTRLCMRQKCLGTKVKTMGDQLITCIVNPLSSHIEEWKKTLSQLEKEHNREAKRAREELKRALSEANRLKRKLAKQRNESASRNRQGGKSNTIGQGVGLGEPLNSSRLPSLTVSHGVGTSSLAVRTELAAKVLEEKVCRMEDLKMTAIKRLMMEERGQYCFFFNCLRPVLETEFSLLGEVSTLHELFTGLSEATKDPSRLLEEAESFLALAAVNTRTSISPNGPLQSVSANEVEAFASAVDAIMSDQQLRTHSGDKAALSLASESLGSTSSGRSSNCDYMRAIDPDGSPDSSQVSLHSTGSDAFVPQQQMMALLRQPRSHTDNGPRSASVGRPTKIEIAERITTPSGVDDVILRRPATNGVCITSTAVQQRPQTTTSTAMEASSLQNFTNTTPVESTPSHRHSTCTLQQLNDTLQPLDGRRCVTKATYSNGMDDNENDDEEEETTSGTLDDETSDDGGPPYQDRLSNEQAPAYGGNLPAMLYPDQSLPPPVYTNLNKLTHAAQRKFLMSTTVASNGAAADVAICQAMVVEVDNLSIASAPHTQPYQTMTKGGIYSVPASPRRPSFTASPLNYRPRGSSAGVEDPFSVEMDDLDRMVTGSSPTSSITSRSGRFATDPPSLPSSHPPAWLNHSTGVPIGLLRTANFPMESNGSASNRNSSGKSCLYASPPRTATLEDSKIDGTSAESLAPPHLPLLEQSNNSTTTSASSHHTDDGNKYASHVSSTAVSLLNQLSGQLQQLGSSNPASLLNHSTSTDSHVSTDLEFPPPPSPLMSPPFTLI